MYVGHHTEYKKAMRVAAAGFAPMEDMLAELDAEEDDLQFAMTAYGLCVLLEAHGETEKADALRQKLLKRDGFWFCFSYLAAAGCCSKRFFVVLMRVRLSARG